MSLSVMCAVLLFSQFEPVATDGSTSHCPHSSQTRSSSALGQLVMLSRCSPCVCTCSQVFCRSHHRWSNYVKVRNLGVVE
eukprot:5855376-Amphidinium_carterae.1